MKLENPLDIPSDIREAAMKINIWMVRNGYKTWEFLDICSRNHADRLRELKGQVLYDQW